MNTEIFNTNIEIENERVLLIPFENQRNKELKKIVFNNNIWKYLEIYENIYNK